VARLEGTARAWKESEILLTLRESLADLEAFRARLLVLEASDGSLLPGRGLNVFSAIGSLLAREERLRGVSC